MHFVDAKGILTNSGGYYGMNIYRGCTHGCIYCDSRSRCYQFTHPFEDIEVKQNAPELLEKALKSKRQKVYDRNRGYVGSLYALRGRAATDQKAS